MAKAKAKETKTVSNGLTVDLSDAQEFEALPSAWYTMSVERAEIKYKESPANPDKPDSLPEGTPFLNLGLATTQEHEAEDDVGANRWVWNSYYMPSPDQAPNDKKRKTMLGMLLGFLNALGYDKDELRSNGFDFENDIDELIHKELEVNVGQREYNGRINNTVKSVRPLSSTVNLEDL